MWKTQGEECNGFHSCKFLSSINCCLFSVFRWRWRWWWWCVFKVWRVDDKGEERRRRKKVPRVVGFALKQKHVKSAHQEMGCPWPLPASLLGKPGKADTIPCLSRLFSNLEPHLSLCLNAFRSTGRSGGQKARYLQKHLPRSWYNYCHTWKEACFSFWVHVIHDSELGCPASC